MEIAESRGATVEQLVRLQFYREPPSGSEQLDIVQNLCLARLRVLKAVEEVGQDFIKGSKEYVERLKMKLGKLELGAALLVTSGVHADGLRSREEVRRDVLSHFLLRLAMCRTEDQRRWFISQETDLFRLRFQLEQAADRSRSGRFSAIAAFLTANGIKFDALSPDERSDLAAELLAGTAGISGGDAELATVIFYRVHFTEALDLVRSRRVFLLDGFAHVPESGVISMVTTRFRSHLSQQLAVTCRALPYLGEDARLVPLLGAIAKNLASDDWSAKASGASGIVLSGQVDQLAKASFPPCMQQLHCALRRDHHLKHYGRLQYGLFLKGIGLPLEEALKFWRGAFAGKVDGDKFAKEYAYGIRYNYGKEGKRTDFSPYSCVRVITGSQPGQGDSHGCPFRHCGPDLLAQRLQAAGIGQEAAQGILAKAKDVQYQLACRDYFRAVHKLGVEHEVSINHPNQYFEESRALLLGNGGQQQPARAAVRVTKVKAAATNQSQAASAASASDWLDDTVDHEMSQVDLSTYEACE